MQASAGRPSYPPVGTRVRWTSAGRTREGVVVLLKRAEAKHLAFQFGEVFGWPPTPWRPQGVRFREAAEVVDVDTVGGQPRTGPRRYYHPRPQWLEVVETGEVPG